MKGLYFPLVIVAAVLLTGSVQSYLLFIAIGLALAPIYSWASWWWDNLHAREFPVNFERVLFKRFVQLSYDPAGWWITDNQGHRIQWFINFSRIKDRKSTLVAYNMSVLRVRLTFARLPGIPFAEFDRVGSLRTNP